MGTSLRILEELHRVVRDSMTSRTQSFLEITSLAGLDRVNGYTGDHQ